MPKIESEKIDCLHRPWSRPAPRGKIESVRTQSEVIGQFDSFSLLKLMFLVRHWHCWSWKAFPRQMTPQSREKNCENGRFRHRWQAWKVVRSIAAVRQRPRTPRNWRCSFAFFESFLRHFNEKERAEVIFSFQGLSRVKIRKMAQGSNDLSTLPLINPPPSLSLHKLEILNWLGPDLLQRAVCFLKRCKSGSRPWCGSGRSCRSPYSGPALCAFVAQGNTVAVWSAWTPFSWQPARLDFKYLTFSSKFYRTTV